MQDGEMNIQETTERWDVLVFVSGEAGQRKSPFFCTVRFGRVKPEKSQSDGCLFDKGLGRYRSESQQEKERGMLYEGHRAKRGKERRFPGYRDKGGEEEKKERKGCGGGASGWYEAVMQLDGQSRGPGDSQWAVQRVSVES